jgi:N-dimethylarginine dimethylaminohydrolase
MKIVLGHPKLFNKKLCNNIEHFKNLDKIIGNIKDELTKLDVEVIQPKNSQRKDISNALWFRDNFINVDNKLYLLNKTTSKERKPVEELSTINISGTKVDNYFIDGGDVIQHNDLIFVGLSDRTEKKSIDWFKKEFKKKEIIKITHHALHLDCCFCVLPNNLIIYSKKYIKSFPSFLKDRYKVHCIEEFMKEGEETNLATNILIIGKNIIAIDRKKFYKFYKFLQSMDFNLILIPFFNLWKDGGGIRCLTQWIDKGVLPVV